ncbi:MAG: hypothetical protein AUJ92_22360 [Armatimonadetes bacterium CG2_30_59_28]|nr:hypothetical protein [Armatimonadota bacterium]OIO89082.1 MAG: hypothetical protein AUJ92_22360 [Armatimonadetes bacterium CG2_30_59_28]PIU64853.1 MAG: hypothetical protein COS85_10945 [Armatimonadetes bacterium CG07_land_8_20_14_0_80_59_28]PIX39795.1 MAG: hypothetical protein COZ56_16445 [Armatimonadetes bacterium CG_4_8_14_3_um_filter_58_9]PIY43405.1 MAG: hypothetical protein COZ05_11140 [Armatimonadetes bacterium CG_4_10_14_3_um_filter_59_10]
MEGDERYYSLPEETERAVHCQGVAVALGEVVVAEMPTTFWDALIAEGRAAHQQDDDTDGDGDVAAGMLAALAGELDDLCRSIRTIGKSRFKRTNPILAREFHKVPPVAYSIHAIIDRAKLLDIAWGRATDAATWEPVPGLKRVDFQAKIAAVEAADLDCRDKENVSLTASDAAQQVARRTHDATVAYRTQGLASFPRGSREWQLFDGIPPTDARPHSAAAGGEPPLPTP